MSKIESFALEKKISRDIVKEIESFGVSEDQKIDIMYFLALTLQDNNDMQKVCKFLKNFKKNINTEETANNNNKTNKKIITLE